MICCGARGGLESRGGLMNPSEKVKGGSEGIGGKQPGVDG